MSNGVLLPLNVVIFERIFLLSSSVFIVDFENLNDGWECSLHDFNNRYTSDHQYFKKPDKNAFGFYSSLPEYSEIFGNL